MLIDRRLQSHQFFQLPLHDKLKSPHPPKANPHRGYTACGVENVSAASNHDAKVPMPLLQDMKVGLPPSPFVQSTA
jgi:isopenicillin N synthase-like dioxygenase